MKSEPKLYWYVGEQNYRETMLVKHYQDGTFRVIHVVQGADVPPIRSRFDAEFRSMRMARDYVRRYGGTFSGRWPFDWSPFTTYK